MASRQPGGLPQSREKILEVAEALFARSGYAGVGLREVASEVGLGKSSLFHHFANKQQLYHEVLCRVLERIRERIAPALDARLPAMERLARTSDALVDVLAEHPTTARLLLRALVESWLPDEPTPESAACDASIAQMVGSFERLLGDGIASGEFRDVSVSDTTQTLIGAAVFHFASGELGESLLGGSIFSAEAVARRRRELRSFLQRALAR